MNRASSAPVRVGGRYSLHDPIAAGGMATVHLGRLHGSAGFSRIVAIKRLHAQLSGDPEIASMLLDEARLAARVMHPNVVQMLDVVEDDQEVFLVMEYIHGEPLSLVIRAAQSRGGGIPPNVAVTVVAQALYGIHAAHEARSELGTPLGIVHRDISPQNIMIGSDGVTRVLDFGIAKARSRVASTVRGQLKGKIGYMAPEQLNENGATTPQIDVYAAAVCLWEALTGARLFDGENPGTVCMQVLHEPVLPPSARVPGVPAALDAVVMKGLARDPSKRYATALEMAIALEGAIVGATPREVAEWLEGTAGPSLAERARVVTDIESQTYRASGGSMKALSANEARASVADLAEYVVADEYVQTLTGTTAARPRWVRTARALLEWAPAMALVPLLLFAGWAWLHGEGWSFLRWVCVTP